MNPKSIRIAFLLVLIVVANPAMAAKRNRPTPATRDPHTPGYVEAKELPDGAVPPADAEGNFIIRPTHNRAPEMTEQSAVPKGTIVNLTMKSTDSKIYPGIARDTDTFGTPDPKGSNQARRHHHPHGAWEYHEHLIADSPKKPLRIWLEVGDRDLYNPNAMRDNMHDWVVANENMAKALAAKGYDYQFIFARNATHCDGSVKQQTLPEALEWLWKGYTAP